MICQSYEGIGQHSTRPTLRWKEWIPLISQQLRLRNLVQLIAFNISVDNLDDQNQNSPRKNKSVGKLVKSKKTAASYYFTLHLTTMSAPFYTSEKLEHGNPKWSEIEPTLMLSPVNAAVNAIVVRLWSHQVNVSPDSMITMWGVYFNGLIYLGSNLLLDPLLYHLNTLIFNMQGGYFTAAECLKESPNKYRNTGIDLMISDVKPSYKLNSLLNLHTKQQAMRKLMLAAQDLRDKISVGGFAPKPNDSTVLQRLLNESRPKAPKRQELLKAQQAVEVARFQVEMLAREKTRKQTSLLHRDRLKAVLTEANMDKGLELMSKYQNLHHDIGRLKEWRRTYVDTRETFLHSNAQLTFRRKQLIAELHQIYPIIQFTENNYSICGLHLPNSDNFSSDEVTVSVALGLVAHLVQMIAIFLQVPLRYPIVHFSSRSKIIDHVADKIPDKDREFPLFLRGRDRLQFNYGVYLLNKNIAQLRFYYGMATRELPATLPNLLSLLQPRPGTNGLEISHSSLSGSLLDLCSLVQTSVLRRHIPVNTATRGHRTAKSEGGSELTLPLKITAPDIQPAHDMPLVDLAKSDSVVNNLSYSLDKGLDEYEDIRKADVTLRPVKNVFTYNSNNLASQGFIGSEPILTTELLDSKDGAQKRFLQIWQAGGGPGQNCSDDDFDMNQRQMKVELKLPPTAVAATTMPNLSEASIEHSSVVQFKEHIAGKSVAVTSDVNECDIGAHDEFTLCLVNAEPELDRVVEQTDLRECESITVCQEIGAVFDCEPQVPNGDETIQSMSKVFARTEALASSSMSFNRVRSRHSGSAENAPS